MERVKVIKSEDFDNKHGIINDLQQAILWTYPEVNGLYPNLVLISPGLMYSLQIHNMENSAIFDNPITKVFGVKIIETPYLEHKSFEVY